MICMAVSAHAPRGKLVLHLGEAIAYMCFTTPKPSEGSAPRTNICPSGWRPAPEHPRTASASFCGERYPMSVSYTLKAQADGPDTPRSYTRLPPSPRATIRHPTLVKHVPKLCGARRAHDIVTQHTKPGVNHHFDETRGAFAKVCNCVRMVRT